MTTEHLKAEARGEVRKWFSSQEGACACLGDCSRCNFHKCHGCLCFLDTLIDRVRAATVEECTEFIRRNAPSSAQFGTFEYQVSDKLLLDAVSALTAPQAISTIEGRLV